MNIKYTLKSTLLAFMAFAYFISGNAQSNTGFIRGTVYRDNQKIANVDVVLLDEYGDSLTTTRSEINGEYSFNNLNVGIYTVIVRAVPITKTSGYNAYESDPINLTIQGQVLNIDLISKKIVTLTGGGVRAGGAKVRETGTTTTVGQKTAQKTGLRGLGSFAGLSGGVNSGPSGISSRGSRTDGNAVYIDGVRVNNSSLTQAFGAQVDIMQAGIPAQYGDFTGLGISITTKGGKVSSRKAASLEVRSNSAFTPYHGNLIEGFYAAPLFWKVNKDYLTGKSSIKRIPIAAINVAANFSYAREPNPSYIGYYVIKDEKLAQIEQNPLLINTDGSFVHAANYLTENDYDNVNVRPNVRAYSSSAQMKLDFQVGENATLAAFGNFQYSNSVNGGNQIMA
ncbi:MAG: SdrD B-like domain-containing protein, partial [Bacteroidia bacterium]